MSSGIIDTLVYGLRAMSWRRTGGRIKWEASGRGLFACGYDSTLDSALAAATQYATAYAACHWMERFCRVLVCATIGEARRNEGAANALLAAGRVVGRWLPEMGMTRCGASHEVAGHGDKPKIGVASER